MRTTYLVGNWKMHYAPADTRTFLARFLSRIGTVTAGREIVFCPPALSLESALEAVKNTPVSVGAQNVHHKESGAYTGEISAPMLQSMGVKYGIVGHSERRQYFGESDVLVNQKAVALLNCDITPIICVGETLEQREAGEAQVIVRQQVEAAVAGMDITRLIIAYEPVWAIGTGKTATPADAQEVHDVIRDTLRSLGDSQRVPILYGGSVKPENIDSLMAQPDIDGALVGGASLEVESFLRICQYNAGS